MKVSIDTRKYLHRGWRCDCCRYTGDRRDRRWFCPACSFDVCFSCHRRPGGLCALTRWSDGTVIAGRWLALCRERARSAAATAAAAAAAASGAAAAAAAVAARASATAIATAAEPGSCRGLDHTGT